jgi:hypothetical protein
VTDFPIERHDEHRQLRLRAVADEVCAALVERFRPVAVYLLGSVARGPCGPGSDVDLLVITADEVAAVAQDWSYHASGTPVDVKRTSVEGVASAAVMGEADFAGYCVRTMLPDYLSGAVCLATDDSPRSWELTERAVPTLVARRFGAPAQGEVARLLTALGARLANDARRMLDAGAAADAHALLLKASKPLLESLTVAAGQQIRGSKKRPELLHALVGEGHLWLDWQADVVGFTGLGPSGAATLTAERWILRRATVQALEMLVDQHPKLGYADLLVVARRHAAASTDYYAELLDAGFWRGVVNHIRVHGGIARIPSDWCLAAGHDTDRPVAAFMAVDAVPATLRDQWWSVSGLTDSPRRVADLLAAQAEFPTTMEMP